jgi:outer membrane biosynthesis protein TonB
MKNQKKLIVIATMIALLICAAMLTCALADEKIYTSPSFKLPADQIMEWAEDQPEGEAPEAEAPAEEPSEKGEPEEEEWPDDPREDEEWPEDPREDEELDPVTTEQEPEAEEPAEGTEESGSEVPAEVPEGETPAEGSEEEAPAETPAEGETPAQATEPKEEKEQTAAEAKTPERTVMIRSSQGDVVTEGEIIYLTSKLKGFDGLDIAYQWQVDRGDGAGWVDVEGANRSKHMFVADRETITYSWRLIVTVIGEE